MFSYLGWWLYGVEKREKASPIFFFKGWQSDEQFALHGNSLPKSATRLQKIKKIDLQMKVYLTKIIYCFATLSHDVHAIHTVCVLAPLHIQYTALY